MVLKQGEWRGSKLTGLTVYNNNDDMTWVVDQAGTLRGGI
jgi:hypothetical protein